MAGEFGISSEYRRMLIAIVINRDTLWFNGKSIWGCLWVGVRMVHRGGQVLP